MLVEPRRTPHRQLLLAGTALIAVTYGLVRFGYGLYLPELGAELGLTSSTAGAVATGSFLAYCVSALVADALLARGRGRTALWVACFLTAVGAVGVAGSWSTPSFAVAMLVAGSGAGAASPALVAAVASTLPPERRPRGQATVNSGTGVGVLLGGVLVAVAGDAWRASWVGFAVLAVAATWWADARTTWPPPVQVVPRERPHRSRRPGLLRRPLVAAVLAGSGSAAVWTFGRDLLVTDGGMPGATTGLLWAALGGAGVLGAVSGDLVVRLGLRGAWLGTVTACAAGTALLALTPSSLPAAALALALFGGAYVALSGVLIAWGERCDPRGVGSATAVLFVGLTVGQALGSLLTGALADRATLPSAFAVAATATLLACLAAPRER